MDIHITPFSKKYIKNTNILQSDCKVIPYNTCLERKAKKALGTCIHTNTNYCLMEHVCFAFNIGSFNTKKNLPYLCLQLLKNNFLNKRINPKLFLTNVIQQFNFTNKQAHALLSVFVKFRFLRVLNDNIYLLFIKQSERWDIHFIQQIFEKKFIFFKNFNAKEQKFIWTNIQFWKPRLIYFLKKLFYHKLSFDHRIDKNLSMLQVGETSFDWYFSMQVNPKYFLVLPNTFDETALLIWHFYLIDSYLKINKLNPVFQKEISTYVCNNSVSYLKKALKNIPDMWNRGVPEALKKMF